MAEVVDIDEVRKYQHDSREKNRKLSMLRLEILDAVSTKPAEENGDTSVSASTAFNCGE